MPQNPHPTKMHSPPRSVYKVNRSWTILSTGIKISARSDPHLGVTLLSVRK